MTILSITRSSLKDPKISKLSLHSRIHLKALWLKHTYSFIWAHKPLCQRYREDVFQIKNIYLCRSCFFAYTGIFTGSIAPLLLPQGYLEYCNQFILILVIITLPLSYPAIYKKLSRVIRDCVRFCLGTLMPLVMYSIFKGHLLMPLFVVLLSIIVWKIYYRQRSKRKIQLCESCNEYNAHGICPGFTHQAQLIKAYEEEATEYIVKSGYIPKILR